MSSRHHARIWAFDVPTSWGHWAPLGTPGDPLKTSWGPSREPLGIPWDTCGAPGAPWGHTGDPQWSAKDLEAPRVNRLGGRWGPRAAATTLVTSIPESAG